MYSIVLDGWHFSARHCYKKMGLSSSKGAAAIIEPLLSSRDDIANYDRSSNNITIRSLFDYAFPFVSLVTSLGLSQVRQH